MKVTAKKLRKRKSIYLKKENCFICGKHKEITELHHVLSLEDCAMYMNLGILKKIQIPLIWLCPNHHRYIHKDTIDIINFLDDKELKQFKKILKIKNNIFQQLLNELGDKK